MKGGPRRNQSAAIRALKGSRTRPRHKGQPTVAPGAPEPPEKMTAAARAVWAYYAPLLAEARILTAHDREVLALFCESCAQVRDIQREQAAPEYRRVMLSITVDGAGNERVRAETNPLDVQLRAWTDKVRLLAADLGLSPMARARVQAAPADEDAEADPLETMLRRVK